MNCPKDKAVLEKRIYEAGIEIDECPRCKGIWLDAGELEQIQEIIEVDHIEALGKPDNLWAGSFHMAEARQELERACPVCGGPMEKREYAYNSQIMIDTCIDGHGVWLDKGELEALEVFFERLHGEDEKISRGFFGSLKALFK